MNWFGIIIFTILFVAFTFGAIKLNKAIEKMVEDMNDRNDGENG